MTYDFKALYNAIRANQLTLDSCARHCFDASAIDWDNLQFRQKAKCKRCGGEMLLTEITQYVIGFEAAGNNPNDILEGFRVTPGAHLVGCPQCNGMGGIETFENDFHDCPLCDGAGEITQLQALSWIELKELTWLEEKAILTTRQKTK